MLQNRQENNSKYIQRTCLDPHVKIFMCSLLSMYAYLNYIWLKYNWTRFR